MYMFRLTACLYYRSNCTKSICLESIQLQDYVYTSGAESDQFDPWNCIYTCSAYYTATNLIQLDSIRVPQSEVVPSESNQFDSIRVYSMSETEPVRSDLNLHPSVNGLLVQACIGLMH